jgi:hypothetical protein
LSDALLKRLSLDERVLTRRVSNVERQLRIARSKESLRSAERGSGFAASRRQLAARRRGYDRFQEDLAAASLIHSPLYPKSQRARARFQAKELRCAISCPWILRGRPSRAFLEYASSAFNRRLRELFSE